jgi:inward rectifier potassium channel
MPQQPFIRTDGSLNVHRVGIRHAFWQDWYYWLLQLSWMQFWLLFITIFMVVNTVFAFLYLAQPGSISAINNPTDAFFFSVQTMSTVGYGVFHPLTLYAHILMVLEVMVGMVLLAMLTGLVFARFSRPTAQLMFSHNMVIAWHNGVPTLMFRIGNRRRNRVIEAKIWATLIRDEVNAEGYHFRRIHDLGLVRGQMPFLELALTAMHPIAHASPLIGCALEELEASDAVIFIVVTGTDETLAQPVYARKAYTIKDIMPNHSFAHMFGRLPNGQRVIDYKKFNDVVPHHEA